MLWPIKFQARRRELEEAPDAYILFGRCYDRIEGVDVHNGYRLIIRSPWTKVRSIIDPKTFKRKTCRTRTSWFWMWRTPRGSHQVAKSYAKVYVEA